MAEIGSLSKVIKLKKKIFFYLILVGMTLAIVEIVSIVGFQLMGTSYVQVRDDFNVYHDLRKNNADYVRVENHPYLPYVYKPYSLDNADETGMRIYQSISPTTVEIPFTIATIGGSTTAGPYPRLLFRHLREQQPQQDVQVINAGIPAWTSAESLINLALRVIDYQPDLLIIYHGHNDVFPSCAENFRSDYSHWRKSLDLQGTLPTIFDYFPEVFDQSAFYVAVRRLLTNPQAPPPNKLAGSTKAPSYFNRCDFNGRETFRRNLKTMVGIASVHDIDILFVSQSVHIPEDKTAFVRRVEETRQHNIIMEEIAEEFDKPFIDFYDVWDDEERATYHTDIIHLTLDGYIILAETIGNYLLDNIYPVE